MFGSSDSIANPTTTGLSKLNQNSRSKLPNKHNRNIAAQNSGATLNFAKVKNSAKLVGPGPSAQNHQIYDPKKENLDFVNRNQEARG